MEHHQLEIGEDLEVEEDHMFQGEVMYAIIAIRKAIMHENAEKSNEKGAHTEVVEEMAHQTRE